jgi:hypothetical protein
MAWFCPSLAVLWGAKCGEGLPEVGRRRPWYRAPGLTFTTAPLGKLRLAIWTGRFSLGMSARARASATRKTIPWKTSSTASPPCAEAPPPPHL